MTSRKSDGEIVEQTVRRAARTPPVDMPGVVLDAGAGADLAHHLDVVAGPHPQPLGLQQLLLAIQLGQPLVQLGLDAADRPLHPLRSGHVVAGREQIDLAVLGDDLAGERMQRAQLLDLVAEELHPDRELLVHREHLERVPAHPEGAPRAGQVVARVLDADQPAEQRVPLHLVADPQPDHPADVLLRRTQAVDRRDRRHHDDVAPGQQRIRGGVPEPLDLLVERGVLLDVGVGLRDVRLGLVVVVVGHEVFDGIAREELPQLVGELRRQGLVGLHHQDRPLQPLGQPGHRGGLAGAGRAQQHDVLLAACTRSSSSAIALGWSPDGEKSLSTLNGATVRWRSSIGRMKRAYVAV